MRTIDTTTGTLTTVCDNNHTNTVEPINDTYYGSNADFCATCDTPFDDDVEYQAEVTISWCAFARHGDATTTATITARFDGEPKHLCEDIFAATNTYGDMKPELWEQIAAVMPAERSHTSLSVGDRITIAGTTYECQPIGFADINEGTRHNDPWT